MFDENRMDSMKILDYSSFEDIFMKILNIHAPVKTKIIRANNHKLMAKDLWKAIMATSRLKMSIWKIKILLIGITTNKTIISNKISINKIFVPIYYEKENLIIS